MRSLLPAVLATLLLGACEDSGPTEPPVPSSLRLDWAASRAFSFTTIEVPGALFTSASGITANGDIVGSFGDATGTHGFLLRGGEFTTIDYPGAAFTAARGIAPNGEIVGSYRMPGEPAVNSHGFLRSRDGTFRRADHPDHTNTIAQRILPDGTVLGCRHDNDMMASMRGVVMSRRGNEETDAFASMHNGATPGLRRIAGLYTNEVAGRTEGYIIDDGVFTPFIVPGSTMTAAWDVNPAGHVVGLYRDDAGGFHGFVLTGDGFNSVDVPGATATRVFGINARGDLVGQFVAGGRTFGLLVR